jgi:hypothetical protein
MQRKILATSSAAGLRGREGFVTRSKWPFPIFNELALRTTILGTDQQSAPLKLDWNAEPAHFMPGGI